MAVVGGGVTGAAVAWLFAEAGVRVALLEAQRIGAGSTAASTALLMQEPDQDFLELAARYGTDAATAIWRLSRQATRDFVDTLRTLNISCELAERDSVYYTTDAGVVDRLRHEHQARRAARAGGRWLDARALRRATGIAGAAAIRTSGNAQVDPYKACSGLIQASEQRGARVFERSPVHRINRSHTGVELMTPGGQVRADRVIVATGYATPDFKPLVARFRMLQTYVVATERLAARARDELGLGDLMLWDTGRPYYYARWTSDGRLLLGGGDHPRTSERQRAAALRTGIDQVRTYFEGLYPALAHAKTEYAWEGLFATTPDGLPYIGPHRRYPRHVVALGYGGNGMTFGFLAARLLLDWYRGRPSPHLNLFTFNRVR